MLLTPIHLLTAAAVAAAPALPAGEYAGTYRKGQDTPKLLALCVIGYKGARFECSFQPGKNPRFTGTGETKAGQVRIEGTAPGELRAVMQGAWQVKAGVLRGTYRVFERGALLEQGSFELKRPAGK